MYQIILASASPRRGLLLEQMGIPYRSLWADINEEALPPGLPPEEAPIFLSGRKVAAVADLPEAADARWILGADTLIIDRGETLGKPRSVIEARAFLERLSGKKHEVVTGIALFDRNDGSVSTAVDSASVVFAPLDEADISWYVETGEWRGVAGGYRIQERGACLIERIEGSYSTVMGLPIRLVYVILKSKHYPL
jgi:septum formation protein